MSFPDVMGFVICAALVIYALTGGADFGGGIWDLLARGPRANRQREIIEEALAPIWEANHVWLILVITVLFSAFPPAFGAIMTALHIPLTLVLIGIVFRGTAFVFRKYDAHDDHIRRRWSRVFGAASFLTPFFLGISLGGLASGTIRVEGGIVATGFFAGWTGAFAIGVGLFAQGLFAFLAAAYLCVESEGEPALQSDFRWRALLSGVSLAPAAALVYILAPAYLLEGLTQWWLLLSTSVLALAALSAFWKRRFRAARVLAAGQVALILIGWMAAQYPHLVVPDMTLYDTATDSDTLRLLMWTLAAGSVLLFPSFAYLFVVFKRK